ncbi:MAG TPA: vanadium-dependent haloperoxidase [Mesorhizobium sp.]|nr:vanadium-dependent haloperoxidase [Mesorhizobium sp.]
MIERRGFLAGAAATLAWTAASDALASSARGMDSAQVLRTWYRMVLELVRHTPTYSPPVASRAFAYLGVTAHEAAASGSAGLRSLAGQLNGLEPFPARTAGTAYDDALVLHTALADSVRHFFGNTGPTGQRAMASLGTKLRAKAAAGLPAEIVARSEAFGAAVAAHVVAWSAGDGGANVENMGFPLSYALGDTPGRWTPTSLIAQQQAPLLPRWGENRGFAMPSGASCGIAPPPPYSEQEGSAFFAEAREVHEVSRSLDGEQRAIARFWSDDPMLSPTPPGHWIAIALQILKREEAGLEHSVEVLARLGAALADSFIACWHSKYEFDLLRPVTFIRRHIDPQWEPLLITPPFPEYPSGHSTQSGAAAVVLSQAFGEDFAFEDATHEDDGLPTRAYPSFWAAAEEAALSRLYGGIHFRAAVERGLEQGRCVGAYAVALRMRR